MITLGTIDEVELLKVLVAVEKLSDHPLAKAIVRDGLLKLGAVDFVAADNLEEVQGKGVQASLNGKTVLIGNLKIYGEGKIEPTIIDRITRLEVEGKTTMLLQQDGKFIGIVGVMDVPRKMAKPTISFLRNSNNT